MDDKLIHLAMEAIREPLKWQRVLEHLMEAVPAKAAIITLRDGKTCQIVNDLALEQEYHSPLICGFSLETIVYYLQELRTIDPWADAQKVHYPGRPLLMSRICPPRTTPDQRFFSWLRDLGIEDTIVFELETLPGFWTACNIFLGDTPAPAVQEAMDYVREHYLFLRQAWQAGQQLLRGKQSSRAALDHMARLSIPACVASGAGELLGANSAFEELQRQGKVAVYGPAKRLCVSSADRVYGDAEWLVRSITEADDTASNLVVTATAFTPDPLFEGKREELWLVTFQEQGFSTPIPDTSQLSEQERALFKSISSGASIKRAGEAIGVQRSRAFEIWASIKGKLGIHNALQIRKLK